ncbi:MAG: TPM domain-containing protein [Candidatus Latescibacteria bacterium]|nr:TPM domain-containing protein [Candidatus Latescibacterota bacterium]
MASKVEHLFSAEEQERIAAAVKAAEGHTSGEIVPCIVAQADEYEEAVWRGGAIAAFLVFAGFFCLRAFTTTWLPLGLGAMGTGVVLAGGAGMLLVEWLPSLRRLLAGEQLIDRRVTQRALQAFVEEEVFATRERTGILIFVSLMEHEVRVLGDAGINARVDQEEWEGVVRLILQGMRQGRPAQGLTEAIAQCGALLERCGVARRADDTDELGNAPRTRGEGEV